MKWTRLEKALAVLVVIVVIVLSFASMLAWDKNQDITRMNNTLSNYNAIANRLEANNNLHLYIGYTFNDSSIPADYLLIVAEDQRYHIRGLLATPCLFVDGELIANNWDQVNCELTLLRSRLDYNL